MKAITLFAMLGATTTFTHAYWNLRLYSSVHFQNQIYGQTQSYPTACSALPSYIRDATSSLNLTSTENTICRDNTTWTVRLYGRPECEENWILMSQKANGSLDDLGFVAKRCESFMVECLDDDDQNGGHDKANDLAHENHHGHQGGPEFWRSGHD